MNFFIPDGDDMTVELVLGIGLSLHGVYLMLSYCADILFSLHPHFRRAG